MSEETRMDRSAFHAIRDSQQVAKYETENTYVIYTSDNDDTAYNDGVSPHNSFKVFIEPIGKEHIKKARCRLKFVGLSSDSMDALNRNYGYVKSNLVRNTIVGGRLNSGVVGSFVMKQQRALDERNIQGITTFAGRPDYDDVDNTLKRIADSNKGQVPNGGDAAAPNAMVDISGIGWDDDQSTPLPDVFQPDYTAYGEVVRGVVGFPVGDNWIECDNPFGKTLSFQIMGQDINTLLDLGIAAGQRTDLVLEVQLLPDNQANDKFSY